MDRSKYFARIAEYKLLAKKEVGQNFLIDSEVASRIVSLLDIQPTDKVLEIGCGAGSLSYFLAEREGEADLIDIDEGLLAKLKEDFAACGHLHIQQGNAMKYDYRPYTKIVGNLPYYITSGIIERALLLGENCSKFVFMVQKEAADRLLAKPNTKDYSPLAILIRLLTVPRLEFKVARTCFAPAPHVDSAVISLAKSKTNRQSVLKAYKLASICFQKRRKTLMNNLESVVKDKTKLQQTLIKNGISLTARAEQLTPEQYLSLTEEEILVE